MEGRPKLQGEKPLNDLARRRHLERILKEVTDFLVGVGSISNRSKILNRAVERGQLLLEQLRT